MITVALLITLSYFIKYWLSLFVAQIWATLKINYLFISFVPYEGLTSYKTQFFRNSLHEYNQKMLKSLFKCKWFLHRPCFQRVNSNFIKKSQLFFMYSPLFYSPFSAGRKTEISHCLTLLFRNTEKRNITHNYLCFCPSSSKNKWNMLRVLWIQ